MNIVNITSFVGIFGIPEGVYCYKTDKEKTYFYNEEWSEAFMEFLIEDFDLDCTISQLREAFNTGELYMEYYDFDKITII